MTCHSFLKCFNGPPILPTIILPSKDLPIDCYEQAITPLDLVTRLEMYESEYMVIPHGQSWGLYTPAGYTLDKSLEHSKKFPKKI